MLVATSSSAELIEKQLPQKVVDGMRAILERALHTAFIPFAVNTDKPNKSDFLVYTSIYMELRSELLVLFYNNIEPTEVPEAFQEIYAAIEETLTVNGYKLADEEVQAFRDAMSLAKKAQDRIHSPATPGIRDGYVFRTSVLHAAQLDFCLSVILLYLDGELPEGVNSERISFLCKLLIPYASMQSEVVTAVLDPESVTSFMDVPAEQRARVARDYLNMRYASTLRRLGE